MRNENIRKYVQMSLAVFFALALSIVFFFSIHRIDGVLKVVNKINQILTPFVYGLILAYLLAPICSFFEGKFFLLLKGDKKKEAQYKKLISFGAITISLLIAILTMALFLYLVLPQVWDSILNIANNVPNTYERLVAWIESFIENNPELSWRFQQTLNSQVDELNQWFRSDFMGTIQKFATDFSLKIFGVVNFVKNFLIGLIISVYLLASRTKFLAQSKKTIYSFLKEQNANAFISQARYTNKVFGGFIRGKLLDSLIIGIICFVVCSIIKMPYTMLVSVIVGITNIIPFFGPFIGAIPSILLIFTVSPLQSMYFLVFIILLQQFDGNILGPRILGQTVGIAGFWVLFAILFFGGLWGFVGMIIGVPLFAVIYDMVSRFTKYKLAKKELSTDTEDYVNLDIIEDGVYKKMK